MAEIDPDALLTASQLAALFQVTVAAVCNWVSRGYRNADGETEHLKPARDSRGRVIKDSRGCILYRLLDAAKAEAATSKAARRDLFPSAA